MTDLSNTIAPRSDQLNADDFLGHGPKTIKITKVSLKAGDQPVAISFEGDENKPYLPCKSMRRVLVQLWGGDGGTYIGRSMTLYRDENVKFGGANVGGIRISHLSDISEPVTLALTASKAKRLPYVVKPLAVSKQSKQERVKSAEELQSESDAEITPISTQEFITPDQATVIGDLLQGYADVKAELLGKYRTIANIPAKHYEGIVGVIKEKTGQE